jgi:hypothetical protein
MNNFIHQSNKLLLIATFAVGLGAGLSQLNRANAVVVVGCGDNSGTIGTGAGCVGPVIHYHTNWACQLGTGPGNVAYCCSYDYSDYSCTNATGATIALGNKGDLVAAGPGQCIGLPSGSDEGCIYYSDKTAPQPGTG